VIAHKCAGSCVCDYIQGQAKLPAGVVGFRRSKAPAESKVVQGQLLEGGDLHRSGTVRLDAAFSYRQGNA
jgi:hypothetical protein